MSEKRMNTKETIQEKQRARQHRAKGREGPVAQYEEQDLLAVQRTAANPTLATPADILALQRTVGNQAVQRLLAQRQGGEEGFDLDDETASRINRARGGGQPLDSAVQEEMSARQGYDFSEVRVHTDGEADDLNQQIQAKAFTTDQDIFFRQGEYDPASGDGQELIAHELTHVVQQGTGQVSGGGSSMTVRPAGDAFEQEAEAATRGGSIADRGKPPREGTQTETRPDRTSAADILALQRTVGNRTVQWLLAQQNRTFQGQAAGSNRPDSTSSSDRDKGVVQRLLWENVEEDFKTGGQRWPSHYHVTRDGRVRYAPSNAARNEPGQEVYEDTDYSLVYFDDDTDQDNVYDRWGTSQDYRENNNNNTIEFSNVSVAYELEGGGEETEVETVTGSKEPDVDRFPLELKENARHPADAITEIGGTYPIAEEWFADWARGLTKDPNRQDEPVPPQQAEADVEDLVPEEEE